MIKGKGKCGIGSEERESMVGDRGNGANERLSRPKKYMLVR